MKTRAFLLAIWFLVSTIPTPAKSKDPIFVSPDFNPALVDQISVFVIDLNNDEANNKECIGGAKGPARGAGQSLYRRGYSRKGRRSDIKYYKAQTTPSADMLTKPTKEWLQDLTSRKYLDRKGKEMPPPERWIMFITIDELGSRQNAVKGLGRAALSMYLYDRDQGTLLWHDQATDEHMWGGLAGNLFEKGLIKADACGALVQQMVMKLPKHKK